METHFELREGDVHFYYGIVLFETGIYVTEYLVFNFE